MHVDKVLDGGIDEGSVKVFEESDHIEGVAQPELSEKHLVVVGGVEVLAAVVQHHIRLLLHVFQRLVDRIVERQETVELLVLCQQVLSYSSLFFRTPNTIKLKRFVDHKKRKLVACCISRG